MAKGRVKTMIVILSKKGFDSTNGGIPSPVFAPEGTSYYKYISLPIPSKDYPIIKFNQILKGISVPPEHRSIQLYSLIDYLLANKNFIMNNGKDKSDNCDNEWCHYDPMLDWWGDTQESPANFEAGFGQSDGFVTTIENAIPQELSQEDVVFLFWGRFHEAECTDGKTIRFKRTEGNQHYEDFYAIWGYLRVSSVIRKESDLACHPFLSKYHSHSGKMATASDHGKGQEAIYVSRPDDTWNNGMRYPTYGVFAYQGQGDPLVLSKTDGLGNLPYAPRRWKLPMKSFDGHLTCQQKKGIDEKDKSFWIAPMGQECVWKAAKGENHEASQKNKKACSDYLGNIFKERLESEKQ